jgi:hypothetical protein
MDKSIQRGAGTPQKRPYTADDIDTERWVATTLANDEASADRELVEHFMEGGPMPYDQAAFYIAQRNDALHSPLHFQLKTYFPQ